MVLSDSVKKNIENEYNIWVSSQYAGNTKEERKKLGQFYTPPTLIFKLIENLSDSFFKNGKFIKGKTILDPTSGAGGLLIGAYYAGADLENLYGIELDENILINVCYKRFDKIIDELKKSEEEKINLKNIIRKHIRLGNALNRACYFFDDNDFLAYKETKNKKLLADTYKYDSKLDSVSFTDANNNIFYFDLKSKWTKDDPKDYFSTHKLLDDSKIKTSFFGGLN